MRKADAARIVRSVLCRALTSEQADQILDAMVAVAAEPGTAVMREGERGRGLLILLAGSVEVRKRSGDGTDLSIATIEARGLPEGVPLASGEGLEPHVLSSARARGLCTYELREATAHRL